VWWRDGFTDTPIYEQDDVRAGQTLAGPAIVESPADTFAIPPGRSARLDANRVFHLGGS
jgi:N-methylhydantoinase A/oxoprolinase/acetone carboxylase beta subunit